VNFPEAVQNFGHQKIVKIKNCNYYTSPNKAHPAFSISISYRRIKYLYSNKDDWELHKVRFYRNMHYNKNGKILVEVQQENVLEMIFARSTF
jgi:hypothetical protein